MNQPIHRMKRASYERGRRAEDAIAQIYIEKGYAVIHRNFRAPGGEIDLIVWGNERLRFVEVKARSSLRTGAPEEAVRPWKQQRLRRAAHAYLHAHPYFFQHAKTISFDVAAVLCPSRHIRIYPDAFGMGGGV